MDLPQVYVNTGVAGHIVKDTCKRIVARVHEYYMAAKDLLDSLSKFLIELFWSSLRLSSIFKYLHPPCY